MNIIFKKIFPTHQSSMYSKMSFDTKLRSTLLLTLRHTQPLVKKATLKLRS